LVLAASLLAVGSWLGARASRTPTPSSTSPAPQTIPSTASGSTDIPLEEQRLLDEVARRPQDARAYEQLGSYYLHSGRPASGLWYLQEARALDPHDLKTGLGIATGLEQARFPDAAVAELRALRKRYPGRVEVCRRIADITLATGRPQEAVDALAGATDLQRSPEALIVLARAYQSLRQFGAAEKAIRTAQRLVPDRPEPHYYLGRLHLDRGDTVQAEQAFVASRALRPDLPEPHYGLGLTYLQRKRPGDTERAEEAFRAAVERAPAHVGARRELGQLLMARGEHREAATHFVVALRASKDAEACRGMAEALAAMGRKLESKYHWGLYYTRKDLRPRSAAAFREMAALAPGRTEAVLLLSEAYFRMKQQERAVPLVEAALKRHPCDPQLLERLAALHVAAGNRAAATRVCRQWLQASPEAAGPHWVLGKIAVDEMRLDEGIRELEQAFSRRPSDGEVAAVLAGALLKRPSPESRRRAAELLARAIAAAPGVARYRNQMGLLLREQGDREGARREFLAALDRDPYEAPVYTNLVVVARQLRRPHQVRFWSPRVRAAEDRLREELRLWRAAWDQPEAATPCYDVARFLIRTGDLTKAESQLEEALRLRPGWAPARQALETVSRVRYAGGA
jgi:tetratricopeptide (TPR) repeat protein